MRTTPSVMRALDVLELLLGEADGLPPAVIADRLGLPRSSVHELLFTLQQRACLQPSPRDPRRLQLGVRLFELGSAYASRLDLAVEGRAVAEELARRSHETVHVGVREGQDVLYVAKADSDAPVRMVSAVGRRLPLHLTGVGKALLSAMGDDEVRDLYGDAVELPQMTARSIGSVSELLRQLDAIRRRGLAYDNCESNPFVCCVATTVTDATGQAVAGMSISVPTIRLDDKRRRELSVLVREGADELSVRLGSRAADVSSVLAGSP
jgi:DNA-binding IclR family transcriptional regulator